ncbi:FAD-dependent oxidoreductase [Dyella sp. 2RAB6]|uniref:FAD-dependent oxidoreductase n=1 Tax=Dyella sp. 2RAB6 TaxID=3232992 RepID=UPI003F90CFC9
MTSHTKIDVLICGAGAAGLTLAIELARRGIAFRLVEKMDVPFHGSRGKGIQPRTLEVFEDLGIVDRIMAAGGLYPAVREYRGDGSHAESEVVERADPTPAEPYALPRMLPQYLTEAILRERLRELGHAPEFGCELIDFSQDEAGVVARLRKHGNDEVVHAQYLAGADGGRSFVRKALGVEFPGKTLGVRAIVADVTLAGLSRDAWHRFNDGSMERQLAVCPLAGTELFQIQAPIPMEGEVDLTAAGLTAMLHDRSGRSDLLVSSVSWASAYQMNARLADRYRMQHVFLIGDAAHIHPPTGGQGLNTSIQDAYNLGWKLAAVLRGAADALLDTYEQERRPVAAEVLGLSTQLLAAAKQGDMRRGRNVRQLDLGYTDSTLSLELPERVHGPYAGDRAPDAPMLGASGQPMRVSALLKGTHWTLFGYEADRACVPARPGLRIHIVGEGAELVDDGGHFQAGYAMSAGQWVLVRPDGYIAAIVGTKHLGAVEVFFRYAERGMAGA